MSTNDADMDTIDKLVREFLLAVERLGANERECQLAAHFFLADVILNIRCPGCRRQAYRAATEAIGLPALLDKVMVQAAADDEGQRGQDEHLH
jgi:hypothetical protein